MILRLNRHSQALLIVTQLSSLDDTDSYPKGLIVAFALKRISGEGATEKNGTHEPANDNTNACRTDGNNTTEETVLSEDVKAENKDDKIPGEDVDNKNDLKSEEKENKEGGKASEDPVAESEENGEKSNAAATYKDNMDVILREDLKAVFGKFGTVKVSS